MTQNIIVGLAILLFASMAPAAHTQFSLDECPTFAVIHDDSPMSQAQIQLIQHTQKIQLMWQYGIDMPSLKIDDIKNALENAVGFALLEHDAFYKGVDKHITGTWNIADEEKNLRKYRLRMEHDQLVSQAENSLWRPIIIGDVPYYPGFRVSFLVKNARAEKNQHGKIGNLLLYYSPTKINGRANKANLHNHLLIVNIHLNYSEQASSTNFRAKLENVINEIQSPERLQQTNNIFAFNDWKSLKPIKRCQPKLGGTFSFVLDSSFLQDQLNFGPGCRLYVNSLTNRWLCPW